MKGIMNFVRKEKITPSPVSYDVTGFFVCTPGRARSLGAGPNMDHRIIMRTLKRSSRRFPRFI